MFFEWSRYASSFRFNGDHVDKKEIDVLGRRKRRIISIDALSSPGKRQYLVECLLRYVSVCYSLEILFRVRFSVKVNWSINQITVNLSVLRSLSSNWILDH